MNARTSAPRLIPTGRGSYVRAGSISLAEILCRYDLAAPGHVTMTREEVIAAYADCANLPEWPAASVAGFLYLVAEKSRSLNMQSFNRRELIIQLSEAYPRRGQKGTLPLTLLPN